MCIQHNPRVTAQGCTLTCHKNYAATAGIDIGACNSGLDSQTYERICLVLVF